MYELERTKKFSVALFVIAAVAFVLAVAGFLKGGGELMMNGYENEPGAVTMMAIFTPVALLSLLGGIALRKVNKDVSELLRYLSERDENRKR